MLYWFFMIFVATVALAYILFAIGITVDFVYSVFGIKKDED